MCQMCLISMIRDWTVTCNWSTAVCVSSYDIHLNSASKAALSFQGSCLGQSSQILRFLVSNTVNSFRQKKKLSFFSFWFHSFNAVRDNQYNKWSSLKSPTSLRLATKSTSSPPVLCSTPRKMPASFKTRRSPLNQWELPVLVCSTY